MTDQSTSVAQSPVSLVIPCRPEYVGLCRLVAGAIGLRDGLDEEVIEDMKVIVTEACNCFLTMAAGGRPIEVPACGLPEEAASAAAGAARTGAGRTGAADAPGASGRADCSIRMDFASRPGAIEITVLYPERRELVSWLEGCDSMSEAGLGLTILRSLTDEMVELEVDDGTALRLTRHLPA